MRLPGTVVVLGAVSLSNDIASEMITPLLPLFLTLHLGAGASIVGLVEGVAEATSSLLKVASGWLADKGLGHRRLVVAGYALSNAARPLMGLARSWPPVLLLRFFDRVGKGIRTSPRDALITLATPEDIRGRAFGFHRAMDHAGAMLGPLVAFALLKEGLGIHQVFLASFIPGLVAIGLLAYLPRTASIPVPGKVELRWKALDRHLRALILASGGLAMATVPEAFLALWAQSRGVAIAWIPLIWSAAHAVKALVAIPAGILSDRLGRVPVLLLGWGLRVMVLLLLAFTGDGTSITWTLFLAYGATLAFTEGAERALVGDFAPETLKATAFGLYHLVWGLMALPGGLLFGLLWQHMGYPIAFEAAAVLTACAALVLLSLTRPSYG